MNNNRTLKDSDLKEVNGGNSIDYIPVYSFDIGDTFLNGVLYYVETENINKAKAGTTVKFNIYAKTGESFLLHSNSSMSVETLAEKYEYLGKDYINSIS